MLLFILFLIIVIFLIYVIYKNQQENSAGGQAWSGPCHLQCITGASIAGQTLGLARVCVCQSCVCDLVDSVIRPNETLELIQGALGDICGVACNQAKNVVDYLTTSTEVPREVAGVLRAEVQSNLQQRPYNAAPTFPERQELVPSHTRPDQDRVQPGNLKLDEKLEKLTKVILKKYSVTDSKAEEIRPKKVEAKLSESIKTADVPRIKEAISDAAEKVSQVKAAAGKIPQVVATASENIPMVGEPTSSHASTSRKSCHSCLEDKAVCLGECPNANKADDDQTAIKSSKMK